MPDADADASSCRAFATVSVTKSFVRRSDAYSTDKCVFGYRRAAQSRIHDASQPDRFRQQLSLRLFVHPNFHLRRNSCLDNVCRNHLGHSVTQQAPASYPACCVFHSKTQRRIVYFFLTLLGKRPALYLPAYFPGHRLTPWVEFPDPRAPISRPMPSQFAILGPPNWTL